MRLSLPSLWTALAWLPKTSHTCPKPHSLLHTSPRPSSLFHTSPRPPSLLHSSPRPPSLLQTSPRSPSLLHTSTRPPSFLHTSPRLPSLLHTSLRPPSLLQTSPRFPLVHTSLLHTNHTTLHMELKEVVKVLEEIAPTSHAEPWDNVGLLLEPSSPHQIKRLAITNDLTEEVLEEILTLWGGSGPGLVISYHPPLFKPLKRLTQSSFKERVLVRAMEARLAVYSPHTALDNMEGGINDWLLGGVGEGEVVALGVHKHPVPFSSSLEVRGLSEDDQQQLLWVVGEQTMAVVQSSASGGLVVSCSEGTLGPILSRIKKAYPLNAISLRSTSEVVPSASGGKLLTLLHPASLSEVTQRIKTHLGLCHIRLARSHQQGSDPVIKTVAACAGSGGSVLEGVTADLFLTGEMSHHQVLEATGRGVAVLLCEHSNTERGFLQAGYKKRLQVAFAGSMDITIPTSDKDPLEIM